MSICRESKGLVRPRTMVAGEKHLAEPHTVHAGSVRSTRRFAALLHTDAQDPQGSGKSREIIWRIISDSGMKKENKGRIS